MPMLSGVEGALAVAHMMRLQEIAADAAQDMDIRRSALQTLTDIMEQIAAHPTVQ